MMDVNYRTSRSLIGRLIVSVSRNSNLCVHPRRGGKALKTDRLDATALAEFYANGLLTVVTEPDAEVEQDRDLLRSRQQLIQLQSSLRRHIGTLLRRNRFHYKAETERRTHWQTHHYGWLTQVQKAGETEPEFLQTVQFESCRNERFTSV